jgi:hypothetical protein
MPDDLLLRRVIHPQARHNYRVILKDHDGTEIEIGSIAIQHGTASSVFWGVGHRHRTAHA